MKPFFSTYKNNLLVKVPFVLKDSFKAMFKTAKWCPMTKEWIILHDKDTETALRAWIAAQ